MSRIYQLYIVDDDPIIRSTLAQGIDWAAQGVAVAGTAANGKQALAMMKDTPPDIVITDINMPRMDGIELTSRICELYPDARVILLTGHTEFRYAKSALNMRVLDYLLKPAENELLEEKVRQAVGEIEAEKNRQDFFASNFTMIRTQFLNQLTNGRITDERQIEATARYLGLKIGLADAPFLCGLLNIDDYGNKADDIASAQRVRFEAMHMLNKSFGSKCFCECFLHHNEVRFILSLSGSVQSASVSRWLELLFERVVIACEIELGVRVSIGYGFPCASPGEIPVSYSQAEQAIAYRGVLGPGAVCAPNAEEYGVPCDLPTCDELIAEVARLANFGLYDECVAAMDRIRLLISQTPGVPMEYTKMIYTRVLLELVRVCGHNRNRVPPDLFKGYNHLQAAASLHEVHKLLLRTIGEICSHTLHAAGSSRSELVGKAKEYIAANYQRAELSLNTVASHVGVTPVYLSTIFKQETDVNFMEYLLARRMERAMELLRHEHYKSYEIADMVGFNYPHYFSVCFKKYTGMNPSEFRTRNL